MNLIQTIREMVREVLSEDFRFQYDNKLFHPSPEMKTACQNAIDAATKNKLTGKGEAEGTGLRKAYDIVAGNGMTHGQVKRMKAFFDNNNLKYKQEKVKGLDMSNSGLIQKWNLWGGDAGYKWATKTLGSHKSKNQKSKDNRPKGHKNMMDPTNTRTRSTLSLVKNKLKESYIDAKGNLIGFDPDADEMAGQNEFERFVKKWDAGGRIVGSRTYEYWFPMEAKNDLASIGIRPSDYQIDIATEEPWRGQKFIVLVANPKDWD